MQEGSRRRITSAHVMAALALFIALGSGAYAIKAAKKNSVVSKSVKDNSLHGRDVKDGALTGSDVGDDSLAGADIEESSLAIQEPLDPLEPGKTLRGTFGLLGVSGGTLTGVSFQVPAPAPVDSRHVVVLGAGGDDVPGSGCTGTASDPVAAPGFVCVYPTIAAGTISLRFGWGVACGCSDPAAVDDGSRFGFLVQFSGPTIAANTVTATGTWAYTAP